MKKKILITGSHRSGTTWVGKMITLSPNVLYIHEPFNKKNKKCSYCGLSIDYWFPYVNENNSKEYKRHMEHILGFKYNHLSKIISIKEPKRKVEEYLEFFKSKFGEKDVLVKDPIALLSADWLAETFDMDVIVLIRHPLAFVASIKVKNWEFDFNDFLNQEELMNTKLKPFEKEIREFSKNKHDIIDQGILLWNVFHTVIKDYEEKYPDWIFVKHEELSLNPLESFRSIYKRLGIDFTTGIEDKISGYTQSKEETKLKRDSRSNVYSWKKRLTKKEISRIILGTKELTDYYYN